MITWTNLNQVIYHNILWLSHFQDEGTGMSSSVFQTVCYDPLIGHETNKVEYRKDAIKRVQT